MELFEAGVAKWLRRRFVVPVFVGSSPIICPILQKEITTLLWWLSLFVFSSNYGIELMNSPRYEWTRGYKGLKLQISSSAPGAGKKIAKQFSQTMSHHLPHLQKSIVLALSLTHLKFFL